MHKLGQSYIGWNTESHLRIFDHWNRKSNLEFDFVYGCFSEQTYLLESVKLLENPEIFDIGCATGTTYRFLYNKKGGSGYSYRGLDLSEPAIERARSLYPGVDFLTAKGEKSLYELFGSKADISLNLESRKNQIIHYLLEDSE